MENLNVTIIQSELYWESVEKNLQLFSQKIASISEPTDLIVLPEMFNTGFTMNSNNLSEHMTGQTRQWMRKVSKEKKCAITGSFIVIENGKYYNRLLWMLPDGTCETYDKRHLFRMANEDENFTAGKDRIIVKLKGWNIFPLICYDLRFPVWSRNKWNVESRFKKSSGTSLVAGYDVLLYIANWPERRSHAWKTLLQARAIENQCYVIGVNRVGNDGNNINYSGDSAIIDFKGEYITQANSNKELIETHSLKYAELVDFRNQFPVGFDADEFTLES